MAVKVKVIIEEGIAAGILADGDVEVEIVDIDPDYEDCDALRCYEEGLRNDPALKEQEFTAAYFEGSGYGPVAERWPRGNMMDYGGKYLKIRKALHKAGFDDFHQAGSVSRFHKMNIVCESCALAARFWVCIDGGYGVKDKFFIARRKLPESGPDERTYYNSQEEMAAAIGEIGNEIKRAKMKDKICTYDEATPADLFARHTPDTKIVQSESSGTMQ